VRSPVRWLIAASLALGVAGAMAACSTSNTATIYTPYTGIDVPTASVIAGVGCAAPDGAPGGIDHWLAFLTPVPDAGNAMDAGDAGSIDPIPDSGSEIVAAGIFSCYTPTGTFENINAALTYDVWVLGFPPGVPADLHCDAGTCALSGADALTLFEQGLQQAIVALRCTAVGESGSHPFAHDCVRFDTGAPLDSGSVPDAAGDGSTPDAVSPDASADGSSDAGGD
jgi:hypothetical protein